MYSHSMQRRRFSSSSVTMTERISVAVALLVLSVLVLAGCKSKQDEAIDAAKQQAASTGQPQQVTSVDKQGNTTVSVVRPPAAGQKDATVTTTTIPAGAAPSTVAGGMTASSAGTTANGAPAATGPEPGGEAVIQPLDVRIPAGTTLPIRINQHISVKTAVAGDTFTGSFAESIRDDDNRVIVPRGTPVSGVISAAHRRGHFKGSSVLSLRLTNMTLGGQTYQLATGRSSETKKGKGKRSAALIGGGAGAGMLIGGIATGGVGLLIGGLAGGGAGTLLAGATGNRDLEIPAESIQRFRLSEDLSVVPPR